MSLRYPGTGASGSGRRSGGSGSVPGSGRSAAAGTSTSGRRLPALLTLQDLLDGDLEFMSITVEFQAIPVNFIYDAPAPGPGGDVMFDFSDEDNSQLIPLM